MKHSVFAHHFFIHEYNRQLVYQLITGKITIIIIVIIRYLNLLKERKKKNKNEIQSFQRLQCCFLIKITYIITTQRPEFSSTNKQQETYLYARARRKVGSSNIV